MAERDETLIQRSLAGDEGAFRTLYERHEREVRRFVRRRMPAKLRKRLSAADILQEAYATAFQRLPEHRGSPDGPFRQWLLGIAEFKLKEAARHHLDTAKRAAGRELSRPQRPATHAFGGREPTPSARAIAAETEEALERAMAALPEDYRTILRLIHEEGYGMADAGERIGRSAEAASKLYGRAVNRLAEQLRRNQ